MFKRDETLDKYVGKRPKIVSLNHSAAILHEEEIFMPELLDE